MKDIELLQAMGNIDEKYIEEAVLAIHVDTSHDNDTSPSPGNVSTETSENVISISSHYRRTLHRVLPYLAGAACAVLILATGLRGYQIYGPSKAKAPAVVNSVAMPEEAEVAAPAAKTEDAADTQEAADEAEMEEAAVAEDTGEDAAMNEAEVGAEQEVAAEAPDVAENEPATAYEGSYVQESKTEFHVDFILMCVLSAAALILLILLLYRRKR